ncbi:hypothetical protein K474DRAFT_1688477 [Panus rudis PR-1116 ss-1]|nr:hypothetical protein K474DRAFT_1688477 [Panus rudis PR-1116 ss-1]
MSNHRSQSSMSHSKRPSISHPIPQDRFAPLSPPRAKSPRAKSPPTSPPRSKAVLSTSMARNWLSRASSSSSTSSAPYAPSRPVRISEPQLGAAFDAFARQRGGVLGAGAVVVRTPQEALAGSNVSVYESEPSKSPEPQQALSRDLQERPMSPMSPPLPPIPDCDDVDELETGDAIKEEEEELEEAGDNTPSRPDTPLQQLQSELPAAHLADNIRPALKNFSPPISDYFPPVPPLPSNVSTSPPQMPFEAILLSPVPTGAIDPSKIIVTLETCTMTYRTTLQTLTSRPSFLATYLKSLLPSGEQDDDRVSVNSDADSTFNSIFHHHLASSGLLAPTSTNLHVFLDRPSAPYAHILTYLRSPPSSPEHPASLPRAVQLSSSSSSRLDALLELRDEALYLDLEELYKLCTDEIRLRHEERRRSNLLGLHSRGMSSGSIISSRSLGTLREQVEREREIENHRVEANRKSKDSGLGSGSPRSAKVKSPSPRLSEHDAWHSSPPAVGGSNPGKGTERDEKGKQYFIWTDGACWQLDMNP